MKLSFGAIERDEEAGDYEDTMVGVIEEAKRKADRQAKRPMRRSINRSYIDPESLDQYGIEWRWESDDDWIFIKQDLTEERETELRSHTKKEKRKREDLEFEAKLRVRMSKAGFSQSHIGDLVRTLTDRDEGVELARRSDKLAIEIAYQQLDKQFESEVQELLWEAGCPIDFCERILGENFNKEEYKSRDAISLTQRSGGLKTRTWSARPKPSPKESHTGQQPSKALENKRGPSTAKKDMSPRQQAAIQPQQTQAPQGEGRWAQPKNVATKRWDDNDGELLEEAEYYNKRMLERARPGEAYLGLLKDWSLIDLPPGTRLVTIQGAGGAAQKISWQQYNGCRRAKFFPRTNPAGKLETGRMDRMTRRDQSDFSNDDNPATAQTHSSPKQQDLGQAQNDLGFPTVELKQGQEAK
ncbi:hypothetical protein EPUS_02802 [Endocarpon pusillum Z07020]|uniref:Uncharacterized protein n=1 Tax=Endocarpon pusillum (strain Z07020 / HMAS-L-300199) TaxID=1263415 RepID=U1GKW3_ENDPU|nr:uncharacterized protein EPUS_02802 [Endocarpon pusillum Z07020]ERF72521.1 hypothetical protein EPUS_02802 [Endocarpon pusillum Z07020]